MSRILIGLVVAAALVGGFAVVFPKWAHQLTGMTHTTMRPPTAELIDNAGASADDQTLAILQPPVDAVGGETPPDAFPSDSAQPTFTNASMNATSPTMLAQSNDLRVQGSVPAPRLYGRTSTDDGFGEVPAGAIRAGDCRVVLIEETRVPAEADGVIKEMLVEEGQIVKKGDTIAKLGTERAQRQLDLATANENVAKMDAKNDVNVRDAKNTARISEFEEKGYREMLRDGAAPLFDVNQKILEAKRGRLRVEVAEMDQEKAQLELVAKGAERAIAEDEIKRRTIVAPFDGYVERRYSKLGEWVQPGSPIIHLVQLDQMRLEGSVKASERNANLRIGAPAIAKIRFGNGPNDIKIIQGTIGFVGNTLAADNTYRVWMQIPNQNDANGWMMRPGMKGVIEIVAAPQVQ